MKTNSIFLILFFTASLLYAQTGTGIAVQGIARDVNKSAIAGKLLTFTFTVSGTPSGSPTPITYSETQEITTDAFGVFSHIIGTGTVTGGGPFADVPFGKAHMTLKVEASGVTILDGPLQYAPYAKNAENGVPVGGVIMWSGEIGKIPAGWALCDGQEVNGVNTPNLSGRFVVGYGTPDYTPVNTTAYNAIGKKGGWEMDTLSVDEMPSHTHNVQWAGSHRHAFWSGIGNGSLAPDDALQIGFGAFAGTYSNPQAGNPTQRNGSWESRGTDYIDEAGSHSHAIDNAGGGVPQENRPPYYVLAYIIRVR